MTIYNQGHHLLFNKKRCFRFLQLLHLSILAQKQETIKLLPVRLFVPTNYLNIRQLKL